MKTKCPPASISKDLCRSIINVKIEELYWWCYGLWWCILIDALSLWSSTQSAQRQNWGKLNNQKPIVHQTSPPSPRPKVWLLTALSMSPSPGCAALRTTCHGFTTLRLTSWLTHPLSWQWELRLKSTPIPGVHCGCRYLCLYSGSAQISLVTAYRRDQLVSAAQSPAICNHNSLLLAVSPLWVKWGPPALIWTNRRHFYLWHSESLPSHHCAKCDNSEDNGSSSLASADCNHPRQLPFPACSDPCCPGWADSFIVSKCPLSRTWSGLC